MCRPLPEASSERGAMRRSVCRPSRSGPRPARVPRVREHSGHRTHPLEGPPTPPPADPRRPLGPPRITFPESRRSGRPYP
ncbi:hypothetical protein ATKI12_1052 [Kitasatospora sp. Ki12]